MVPVIEVHKPCNGFSNLLDGLCNDLHCKKKPSVRDEEEGKTTGQFLLATSNFLEVPFTVLDCQVSYGKTSSSRSNLQ